ncbi:MAG: hypothetical protein JKY09_02905 [Crocinitomicaceae bacterium]|nr:hypothetical protein [Crocinitomicaceae bacterium]
MDRNTVFGLVIIGIILSVFTIMNQPSQEEIKAEKEQIELAEKEAEEKRQEEKAKKEEKEEKPALQPKLDLDGSKSWKVRWRCTLILQRD